MERRPVRELQGELNLHGVYNSLAFELEGARYTTLYDGRLLALDIGSLIMALDLENMGLISKWKA